MKDREINLMDIVARILLGWRVILVLMLVGGVLMGGMSYAHSYRTQQSQLALQMQLSQKGEEYYREKLTGAQLYNVYTVLENEKTADVQEAYLQQSVKMQIDALNVPKVELVYYVDAEDMETACQIGQIYKDIISSRLGNWLAEGDEKISAAAMNELIEVNPNEEAEGEKASFNIIIYHVSEEQCLDLAEKAEEYVQEQRDQLVRELGSHEVRLVSRDFSFAMDPLLRENQQSIRDSILRLRLSCERSKENFSGAEQQYYNYMTQDEEDVSEADQVTEIKPRIEIMYVLIGMFIFAFLYVVYIFVKYVLNEKVQITDDIDAIYGVHKLGAIPSANKKKKVMSFVDDGIYKLCAWNKRQFSPEKAIGLAAAAVNMAAKKENVDEICCIGCNLEGNTAMVAEEIGNILKEADISMKVLNNVLYDEETMGQLLLVKDAFLLEHAGETSYDEIGKEIKLLHGQGIKVLGIVVVE